MGIMLNIGKYEMAIYGHAVGGSCYQHSDLFAPSVAVLYFSLAFDAEIASGQVVCMRSLFSYRISLPILAVLLSLALPALAQETEKPEAPAAKPQGPPKQNLKVIAAQAPYEPISGKQRIQWATEQTFGPESWLMGTWTAAIGTARNKPEEYGPHWDGFAKRYGMRFSGIAATNTMEAGLGTLWGEDPRYVRNPNRPFKERIGNVFLLSFTARNRAGKLMPAYARYIAIPGNNFLSNTWRVSSEATTNQALARTGYGVLAEVAGNAWAEFWPDVKRIVFRRK